MKKNGEGKMKRGSSGEIDNEDLRTLMEVLVKNQGLVKQQLDSYNRFVEEGIQRVMNQTKRITASSTNLSLEFGEVRVGKPEFVEVDGSYHPITPHECRERNLTYTAPVYVEVIKLVDGSPTERKEIHLCDIPIMVKSKLCVLKDKSREELIKLKEDPLDPGGYFIINGSERVIPAQEDRAPGQLVINFQSKGSEKVKAERYYRREGINSSLEINRKRDGTFLTNILGVRGPIPVVILLRALGLKSDREIVQGIGTDEMYAIELLPSIEEASEAGVMDQEEALDYIGRRIVPAYPREQRINRAELTLDRNFLPDVGVEVKDRVKKAKFVLEIIRQMINFERSKFVTIDRDHYGNKRLLLVGPRLENLFRMAFASMVKDILYQLEKLPLKQVEIEKEKTERIIQPAIITTKIMSAMATGQWTSTQVGVTRILERANYLAALSNIRRVVSPLSRSYPQFEARALHGTNFGRICVFETTEGPNCGLVKNMAILCQVSVGTNPESVKSKCYELGVIPLERVKVRNENYAGVYVNNILIGYTEQPTELVRRIIRLRRKGLVSQEVNTVYFEDREEVRINCDPGRARRPLIVVEDGKPKLTKRHIEKLKKGEITWETLTKEGVLEFLDADEEEMTLIAETLDKVTEETTHLEVSPSAIFGVSAGIIPFIEYNAAPRNNIGANMVKQALGIYLTNFRERVDSRSYILFYPQRPMVYTEISKLVNYDLRPAGQNLVVAVLTYEGYNMHDALIINKAAIERGLGRSYFYRRYETVEARYAGGQEDKIEIPGEEVKGRFAPEAYNKIGEDGIVEPEIYLENDEVVIGKTSPPRFISSYTRLRFGGEMERKDASVRLRYGEKGYVDKVLIGVDNEGNRIVKVKVRDLRIPEIGDKFTSRHGQKGVIGLIVPQEDMPFTKDGITPDIIMNPHSIPSRMTVGQLLEILAGKVGALRGERVNATPFEGEKEEELRKQLQKLGFKPTGKEVMYNGKTGEIMEAEIFIGISYYQRLYHMVADKMHARAIGPVNMLVRQPTEGKAREGGLRIGEMEKDAIVGHGASATLLERLQESSDKYDIYVCKKCGMLSYYDRKSKSFVCPIHGKDADVVLIETSYAFKLFLQEIMSLGLKPQIKSEEGE